MLAALLPVLILLPCQILAVYKSRSLLLRLLPGLISLLAFLFFMWILPQGSIFRILAVLYEVLLLILCGVGWVIAWSIQKSNRKNGAG